MNQKSTIALAIGFAAAGIFAQPAAYAQQSALKMNYSGSIVATTIDLAPGTITDEEDLAGNGTLGKFTFRKLRADVTAFTFGRCGNGFGPIFRVAAGAGVFRFDDGSLLTVKLTAGELCVDVSDPAHLVGHLRETYLVTGGTGRFGRAAASCAGAGRDCTLEAVGTLAAVLFDASGTAAKLLTNTGEFTGNLPSAALGLEPGQRP